MKWNIDYLEPVEDWLDSLAKEQLKALAKEIRLLELCGNELKLPHSKSLGSGLFELRERRFGLRLYYCFKKTQAVLILHSGDKSKQDSDIEKARGLLKNLSRSS